MTSATEELRRLLDERGVEWTYADGIVSFNDGKHWYHAWAYNDGAMCVSMGYLTPKQAVEATLGRGTCHNAAPSYLDFLCSECGFVHYHSDENDSGDGNEWHYCPSCGARVVK